MKKALPTLLLNVGFYTLFFAGSAVVIPALALVLIIQTPFISKRTIMRRFRTLIKVYGRIVMAFAYPFVKFEFQDCSTARHTPCIYICNHRSASDPFLVAFLPGEFIQIVNVWPFRLPVLGPMARLAGYLSIREMPVTSFYSTGEKLLSEGVSIVVFPEGTRSASSKMGSFHGASFRLAQHCKIPLVPVCLTGNESIPHKGSLKLAPGRIRVRMLEALKPEEFGDMSPFKLKSVMRKIIQDETAGMEAVS